ncbi:MAG: hypothetical protein VKJ46_16650 [Leptolyngbyaceae bacterium]|nr:hypothetical protein [Leptolyngbyaceae bacterium]
MMTHLKYRRGEVSGLLLTLFLTAGLTTVPISPGVAQTSFEFGAPLRSPAPPVSGEQLPVFPQATTPAYLSADRYLVYVNSTNPIVLQQVKQVAPDAFVRSYGDQSLIQSGVFANPVGAQQQVRDLQAQGIQAQILTIKSGQDLPLATTPASTPIVVPQPLTTTVAAPAPTGAAANFGNTASSISALRRGYFVIIPGRLEEIPMIAEQVERLGTGGMAVRQREIPLGPHVAVGPMEEREPSERLSVYLRDFGLDARVYYGR